MKILFFNYEYPPLGGGAANASAYILREYAKLPDLEVDFITSSIDAHYHEEKVSDTITVHRLPIGKDANNLHLQTRKNLIFYSVKAYFFARTLVRQAKRNKQPYDMTHSFFTVPCGFISMLLKFEFGLPYIVSLRGSDVPGYSDRFVVIYKFITPIIKFIWKKAQKVVANSEGLKELANKSNPDKEIGVIYNGIDTSEFVPQPEKKDPQAFKLICVSRVTPRKGIRFLVQAFEELGGQYPQLTLDIIGDGNERQSLEDLVRSLQMESNITFWGLVPHEKVAEYYATANAFVLPSLNEGMSNTMLEAIACGLPVIATDTGGTKELVTDGANGFIVAMQDSHDLAEKIAKLIENPELVKSMSQESRQRAEKMSWENVAKEYYHLYSEVRNLRKMKAWNKFLKAKFEVLNESLNV